MILRAFSPADAQEITGILKEYYKNDYFHAECCNPDYLIKQSQSGKRRIFVAEHDGRLAGVACGIYSGRFPGSCEIGMHIVRSEYRGRGWGGKLLAYCVQQTCSNDVYGVFGLPVTYYDKSQAECERIGFYSCGLWLGRHDSGRDFIKARGISFASDKLHSVVVAKKGGLSNDMRLFLPDEHIDFIKAMYARHGVFPEQAAGEPRGATAITRYDIPEAADRELMVSNAGVDFQSRLDAELDGRPERESCTVFLNMLSPGCAAAYRSCKSRGFYLTGVHPFNKAAEYMLLHREARKCRYVWDELKLTAENRKILDYILEHRA